MDDNEHFVTTDLVNVGLKFYAFSCVGDIKLLV